MVWVRGNSADSVDSLCFHLSLESEVKAGLFITRTANRWKLLIHHRETSVKSHTFPINPPGLFFLSLVLSLPLSNSLSLSVSLTHNLPFTLFSLYLFFTLPFSLPLPHALSVSLSLPVPLFQLLCLFFPLSFPPQQVHQSPLVFTKANPGKHNSSLCSIFCVVPGPALCF